MSRFILALMLFAAGCADLIDDENATIEESSTGDETGEVGEVNVDSLSPTKDQCTDYPGSLGCPCEPGCMENLACDSGVCTTCAGGCGP